MSKKIPQPDCHCVRPAPNTFVPYVPSNADIEALLSYISASDADLYKAVLLAAFGSLRRSEICALTADDIEGDVIRIHKAMVPDKNNAYVVKSTTKSQAGTRLITMPHEVIQRITASDDGDHIVGISPHNISQRFTKALAIAGLPRFRFHDLRHYQASILHALGVPDQYIMARGGWKTDSTLKQVYRHQIDEKRQEVEESICEYFKKEFSL